MSEAEGSFRERRSAYAGEEQEAGRPTAEPVEEKAVRPGEEDVAEPPFGPSPESGRAEESRETGDGAAGPASFPEGAFFDVVQYVVLRISQCLGEIPFDETGDKRVLPREAKAYIDLLGTLRERTREDLSPEAAGALENLLADLRMRYLELA